MMIRTDSKNIPIKVNFLWWNDIIYENTLKTFEINKQTIEFEMYL